jgi:hypothetical protein
MATPRDIHQALEDLERLGLLEGTGEVRNGEPVHVATAYSAYLKKHDPDALDRLFERAHLGSEDPTSAPDHN